MLLSRYDHHSVVNGIKFVVAIVLHRGVYVFQLDGIVDVMVSLNYLLGHRSPFVVVMLRFSPVFQLLSVSPLVLCTVCRHFVDLIMKVGQER